MQRFLCVVSTILFLALAGFPAVAASKKAEISLNGTTASAAIDLSSGHCVVGIQMSTAWTAANINFQCAEEDGGTYQNLYDADGNQIAITVAASRFIDLTKGGNQVCGCPSVKAVSSASQASARTLYLILAR